MSEEDQLRKEKAMAFKELIKPIVKYLNENHHPHTTIIITPTGGELMEGIIGSGPITEFITD